MTAGCLIAATPRSGSNLLCDALSQTGIAGNPHEYASREDVRTWHDHHGCASHPEYFFRWPGLCRTANGVFAAKLMWSQFSAWGHDARSYLRSRASALDLLQSVVGPLRVIRLVRSDLIRQAISWLRAQKTEVWALPRHAQAEAEAHSNLSYDAELIWNSVLALHEQEVRWDVALQRFEVAQLSLRYEDLAADYDAAVARVFRFLGVGEATGLRTIPGLQRQSDRLTEEWARRASDDLGARLSHITRVAGVK